MRISRLLPAKSPLPLRLAMLLVALSVAAACSGDGASPTPTNPETPRTPSSLVLIAGDAQVATPTSAVAIKPIVAVRDAAGVGLGGVTVTFSVDSGNGSLQSTSVVSAADGTASPGDWHLGAAEGRNVITAKVTSLTPVKLVAVAQVATVTVGGQTVSASGGTVTLTQAGSLLNGTTLTLPPGAIATSATIGFTISSSTNVTLPTGMTALTPALTITGPVGALKKPATLTLPAVAPSGRVLMVLSLDANGAYSVLTSSSVQSSNIAVTVGSIDASASASAISSSALLSTSMVQAQQPVIISVAIDPSVLARDFDTNFRPGTDDWDFQRQAIASFPENLSGSYVDPASSMVASSLWYFVNRKGLAGKLNAKFQEAAGIPQSNRRGLRWASVGYQGIPDLYSPGVGAPLERDAYLADAPKEAQQEMNEIKAAMLLSGNKPQPIYVFTAQNMVIDTQPRFGIAYRTVGNAVDLAIPDAPGQTFRISLASTGWTPVSVTTAGNVTYTVDFIAPVQYALLVQDAAMVAQYSQVTAGTIGDAQGWPKPTMNSAFGKFDTASVFLLDRVQTWWECGECADHGFRSSLIDPSPTKLLLQRLASRNDDGSWGPLETTQSFSSRQLALTALGTSTQVTVGFALYQPSSGSSPTLVIRPGWLEWNTVVFKKLPVDLKLDSVLIMSDSTVAYTVTAPGAPAGISYRWKYKGKVIDSTDTNVPAFSRNMTERGRTMMYATILEGEKKRPIGRDSSAVLNANSWNFTSATLTSAQLPPGGIGSEKVDTTIQTLVTGWMNDLHAAPGNGIFNLYRGPQNCGAVLLEQFPPGQVVDTGSTEFGSFRAVLATSCQDPDLAGTFAMGPIGTGAVVGTAFATEANPDVITVPGGSINATMVGQVLQGTFVWNVRYSTGVARYTFSFQAKILIPK